MKGAMIIFLVAVFLLLIVAYLAKDDSERAGSKAYHMLLLGLMKLDIAWAHGMRYIHIALESIFTGYHAPEQDMERIRKKELSMNEYRRNMGRGEYTGKRQYNRKILE